MQYKVEKEGGREKFSRETNKNQEYDMFTFVNKGTECVWVQKKWRNNGKRGAVCRERFREKEQRAGESCWLSL